VNHLKVPCALPELAVNVTGPDPQRAGGAITVGVIGEARFTEKLTLVRGLLSQPFRSVLVTK
jgi:hypothetical protein